MGEGLLDQAPELIGAVCPAAQYAVITDTTLQPLYGEALTHRLGTVRPTVLVPFPAGEWNKTRDTWASLTDRMLSAGLGRDSAVVALGGGVVGDLAGFVAATYLRGVPYVQVPTTLLAMIDSSIGGKTGVDTEHGKNLVGAFHQPRAVLADLATLTTLTTLHVAAGMAEALKHGLIADRAYFEQLMSDCNRIFERDSEALFHAVTRSVEIKASVVAQDEREHGRRAILNFGHTIAHALEAVSGYELLHGEAVALGMMVEAQLGQMVGVTDSSVADSVRQALEAFQLPLSLPETATPKQLLEVMRKDKKVREGTVRFALLKSIGEPALDEDGNWTIPVPEEVIMSAIGAARESP